MNVGLGFEVLLSEHYGKHLGFNEKEYEELGVKFISDDKELIKKTLDDAESAKEYLSIAKEKFFDASGFNPDDKTSSNYAKELSKVIKQLRKLFIPALEEKL